MLLAEFSPRGRTLWRPRLLRGCAGQGGVYDLWRSFQAKLDEQSRSRCRCAVALNGGAGTLRQRTELHLKDPVCANCHKVLDPIGFGPENFDAIGRWRDRDDAGGAIDAAGELPGGKQFTSPKELKAILAARTDTSPAT
jgi:hypothetical protein